jgi:serine phosphatase RsbU (regulator of sigma subunit)
MLFSMQTLNARKSTPDSLLYELNKTKNDTSLIKIYIKISEFYKNSIPDSSIYYIKKAEEISNNKGIKKWNKFIYRLIGFYSYQKGDFVKTLEYYNKSLNYFKIENDKYNIGKITYMIGVVYVYMGDYKKAINSFFEARSLFEKNGFESDAADATIGIANVYGRLENVEKEYEYNLQALKIKEKLGDSNGVAASYMNIGKSLSKQNKYDEAIEFTLKAINISEKIGNNKWIISANGNLGSIYSTKKDFKNGLKYFLKCTQIAEKIGDKVLLSNVYGNIGKLYSELNMQSKAKNYYQKAIDLSIELGDIEQTKLNYFSFYEYYIDNNDYKNAVVYLVKHMKLKDSLLNESVIGQLNELQTKYESNKKEKEIELLNKSKEIQSEQIAKQKILNYGIVIGLLIVCVFSVVLFNRLKVTRKQKQLIEDKNVIIEEKQKEILDSIYYAKRIQNTLLAHQDFLNENIPQNFVYFNPKDIVSGDFYWATKHGNNFYLAVCDSTGHGVPGAFMSLLNIGFLTEAINEKNISETNLIFEYVRERLISGVSKEGQKDGFDGIIVRFNQLTNEITYTAAHNAPILISNNELIELSKDKMPVGIGEKKEQFTCHKIQAKQGDMLYLYTDGYADQFGGPKGKKFKYKSLNELLFSISNNSLEKQKQELETNFKNWKGDLEQVDDVLIIGLSYNKIVKH